MELNLEQLRSVALGAVYVEEQAEGVCFHRFRPEEEQLYECSGFYPKVFAPAGIRLEFETDAPKLEMTVNAYRLTSRSYFRVDVLKDGQMLGGIQNYPDTVENGSYPSQTFPLGVYSGSFSLGEGIKKVTVQLPWSVPCAVSRFALLGATCLRPLKREKKALLYGDSITQGYDALIPSRAYSVRLCDYWGAEGFNKAIGGEVYCPDLASVPCGFRPDYILGAYGCNDWHRLTQPEFEDRCRRFWSVLCANYPGVKKYALTPIWFLPTREVAFGPFEGIEATLRRVLADFPEVRIIRGWDLVPPDTSLFGDGRIHPNNEGFDAYFQNLISQL